MPFLDPDTGYRNNYLWLPKSHISNLYGVQSALTFPQEQKAPICAWEESDTHLVVPREFFPYEEWKNLDFEMKDLSRDSFPKIDVRRRTEPRGPIQRSAFKALLEHGSGVLVLPCGRGKTVVALHAWTELKVPGLVVVHTKDLMYQWIERIVEHTTVAEEDIGIIQGPKMEWDRPIAVAMVHTLSNLSESFEWPVEAERHFGLVVYDEVHHLGAPYFNQSAGLGQGIRWGLTATPDREDGLNDLYFYHLGDVVYENLKQDIIPDTYFARTGVRISNEQMEKFRVRGDVNTQRLFRYLSELPERNAKLFQLIDDGLEEGRTIMVLSPLVDHLKFLHSSYKESGLIIGSVDGKKRPDILRNSKLIFATTQLAKEGLDRKELDTVIMALPFRKKGQLTQILGRIQRVSDDKLYPVGIILEDELVYTCQRQCQALRRHLKELEYPYYTA